MDSKATDNNAARPIAKERLRLWGKLVKVSRFIEDELRTRFRRECNSTLPRFNVMSVLARTPDGKKMSEISELLRVSSGNMTGIVDKLTEEGLVQRQAVPGDRRAQLVKLTPKGNTVFAKHAALHEAWIDEILAKLNADDIEGMIRRLDHLTDAVEEQ